MVWQEVEYSVYAMRQASRGVWRIGQRRPVWLYRRQIDDQFVTGWSPTYPRSPKRRRVQANSDCSNEGA